ncbi:MAG: N-formylglutamate amidohydrolase [Pseudomonadota bacterium]
MSSPSATIRSDLPFSIAGAERGGRWVIACDHATNRVPPDVTPLGLSSEDMARHIAYDPGALGTSLALGEALGAPVVSSNFSRLVIDPNRGPDDPTLIMQLYDGSIIPGNRMLTREGRAWRLESYHAAYHGALARTLAARPDAILVSIHSFTPRLRGRPFRPWEVGVLFAGDRRLSDPLIAALAAHTAAPVGINEPYGGDLPGDTVDRHALGAGRLNALIELRNDVIATPGGQRDWAGKLAQALQSALSEIDG